MDEIRGLVESGLYSLDEIVEMMSEEAPPSPGNEVEHSSLRQIVAAEIERHCVAAKEWPAVTDCDRLDAIFRQLNLEGIVALHGAGYSQAEGLEEIHHEYVARGGLHGGVVGYCFYHGEDLEGVVRGRGLFLAFGSADGQEQAGLEIGERIAELFLGSGFSVAWNRTMAKRLHIKPFRWQRRRPP